MPETKPDRERFVLGDASEHMGFLNCERIAERRHIHGWKVDVHYHEGLSQLFVFDKGLVQGRIDGRDVPIHGPALIWLPAMSTHGFEYQEGMQGSVITVPTSDVARLMQNMTWMEHWINHPRLIEGQAHHNILTEAKLLSEKIELEHRQSHEERNIVLESLFRLLLVCLYRGLRRHSGLKTVVNDRRVQLMRQFQNLIDQHFNEIRSVAAYADLMSVTPTHLSRSIKTVSGKTAGEIIHARILLEAKRQLMFSDMPIAEIAYAQKFASPSYFSRFFSGQTGESPRTFRERMRSV